MEADLSQIDTLVGIAQRKWGTKALSLMTIAEIKELVHKMAAKEEELPVIDEEVDESLQTS